MQREVRYNNNQSEREIRVAATDIYAAETAGTAGVVAEVFLLRPQRTPRRSPSMSSPLAHASAARSAEMRSLKFTNAHLKLRIMSRIRTRGGKAGDSPRFCDVNY